MGHTEPLRGRATFGGVLSMQLWVHGCEAPFDFDH
jgi:hypothetical protein